MSSASPRLALHQLSLYNTGRMATEQIIAAFAARRQQLDRILSDLAAEKLKSRPQHHLIVGQRGMGKTMLLARIAAELRTVPKLRERFIPLAFVEEQYAVDRLSKFWLNCLDSLADAHEMAGNAEGADAIDATVERLSAASIRTGREDQPFAEAVYEAFAAIAKDGGQRPVLLVDNLQLVFERLEPSQQHSLRELLMRPGSPILVGASASAPPQSEDYGAAFYDQFKVHYLRPLDEAEMRDLLVHLAEMVERDDVRQRVLHHPARLKVLRQLTGGNPRTTLTLFFLYAEDFAPSVFGDLEGLLDRVTPLYKSRFEELTPQQQIVASAIANHWDPITAAEVAVSTSLPSGTISSQLDRLEKTGFIERTELFGDSRTGYQLAERFFNIWFLMRSSSRRQRREVEFLTRFLESFYEPEDRSRLARQLLAEEYFSADRYVWSRAVAASLAERETAEDLTRHAELVALREEACDARARLRDVIDFKSLSGATLAFNDLRSKLMSLVPDDGGISPLEFAEAVLGDRQMFMTGERERLAGRSGKFNLEEIGSLLSVLRSARAVDELAYSPQAVGWFSQRLASGQIRALNDVADWNRAFHHAAGKDTVIIMTVSMPHGIGSALGAGNIHKIEEAFTPSDSANQFEWFRYGSMLESQLGRYIDAAVAYRKGLALDPTDPWAWNNLGNVLQQQSLPRFEEAEAAYRKALTLPSKIAWPWTGLGRLLSRLGRVGEAEAAYRECVVLHPSHAWAYLDLGRILFLQERLDEAETSYRSGIAADPDNAWGWVGLGNVQWRSGRLTDAAESFDEAVRLDPARTVIQHFRLFLRRDSLGDGSCARPLLAQLVRSEAPSDIMNIQTALFAAYDFNWGVAAEALNEALTSVEDSLPTTGIWLDASAVLLHLNYGEELLTFFQNRGDSVRMRPWVEALRSLQGRDRRSLRNVAPEIRTTAEELFDRIERRMNQLPEKTRRRPQPEARRRRTRPTTKRT